MSETEKLKMRFKLHQFEFELEGSPEDVKEQYQEIKSFITNDLIPKVNFENRSTPTTVIEEAKVIEELPAARGEERSQTAELPSLKEIKLRDLAKTEADWLVVYCFFASKQGAQEFTRADIVQLYKDSDRHTAERMSHLWQYMKNASLSGVIKPTNDTHFILLEKGKKRAAEIFAGKSKATSAKGRSVSKSPSPKTNDSSNGIGKVAPKSSSKGTSKKFDFDLDSDLDLRPEGKPSLKDFAAGYVLDSTPKRIVVVLHYLLSILKSPAVSGNHIYTGLEELGGKIPPTLRQIFINTKGRKLGWIDFQDMTNIRLTIHGKNALKDELLKK